MKCKNYSLKKDAGLRAEVKTKCVLRSQYSYNIWKIIEYTF